MANDASEPLLLEMRGIEKSFPGVRALSGVDLRVRHGEVLALVGENGAGKSTLIKMLGGAHQPDAGSIAIEGEKVVFSNPTVSASAGVGIIYQEFNLVPGLSAWENIFLGRESSLGWVHRGRQRRAAQALFERIGTAVPIDVPCGELSVAQQQIVEIAKALSQEVRLIVMDEPSATLTPSEVEHLFTIIRDLQSQRIGVIYISHRLDEIAAISDRVTVLRDGTNVGEAPIAEMPRRRMIEMMVGRKIDNEFPRQQRSMGKVRLDVRGLCRGNAVCNVSFRVHAGEILGITGLVGAGRTETARLIFGADRAEAGEIYLDDRELSIESPRDAIAAEICLLTEDRKSQGLVIDQSVRHNFGLANMNTLSRFGFVSERTEQTKFGHYVERLKIKIPHQDQIAKNLSGGNQQKVVLAKWLQRNASVIIFDEPTRGIDVGAKYEIYMLMNELAASGKAIIMISSELPEVIGMSDRILVMHEGRITGAIEDAHGATQSEIMEFAVG